MALSDKEERQKIADMMGVPLDQIHRLDITPEGNLTEVPDKVHVEFWGDEMDEVLSYEDMDEYIESVLDDFMEPSHCPETLIVWGYAHKEMTTKDMPSVLDNLLEGLDEDFGNPDGGYSEVTEAMKEAEKVFLEVVRKEYTPWICEPVCKEEINVTDWIKENRPDWLEEKKI
jgi:hypothetical protein